MKAEDLMIGDWVKFPIGFEKIVEISYVQGVGYCVWFPVSATLFPCKVEDVEPIPITPEILLDNGFEQNEAAGCCDDFYFSDDYFDLYVVMLSDSIWKVTYSSCEMSTIPYSCNTVCHVHELQHVLKLYGVDKEIVIKED